jgi:hypothetical protein
MIKPALRLITSYRLVIEEVTGAEVITSYARWVDAVASEESGLRSLCNIKSKLRAHLVRIKEAPPGLRCRENNCPREVNMIKRVASITGSLLMARASARPSISGI